MSMTPHAVFVNLDAGPGTIERFDRAACLWLDIRVYRPFAY
jgi:hypothetical protein